MNLITLGLDLKLVKFGRRDKRMNLILLSSLDQTLEKLLPLLCKNISASFSLIFGISCTVKHGDEYPSTLSSAES